MNRIGLPYEAVWYITETSPSSMKWLHIADAKSVGIDVLLLPPRTVEQNAPRTGPPVDHGPAIRPEQPTVPQFSHYPVRQAFAGPNARPILDTVEKNMFRTRLRQGANGPPDFAGRYRIVTWGCGTACVHGAAVDLTTGRVTFLPGSISGWGMVDEKFQPVERRAWSSLIVLSGQINEQGVLGAHFFHLKNDAFEKVHTIAMEPDFQRPRTSTTGLTR